MRDTKMHVAGVERHALQVSPPHAQINEAGTQRHAETVRLMHFQKRFLEQALTARGASQSCRAATLVGERSRAVNGRPLESLLDGNLILALDEAAGVLPCPDVLEDDVARYRAKERNPGTDEDRNASDNEALNEPGLKKPLNGDSAIHINVPDAASRKLRHDFGRSPRHPLHHSPERGGGERASAEHETGFSP